MLRTLVLSVLCLLCLPQRFGASVSIIERDIEPTDFVTTAATSYKEPIWLVVPMLLDVQPVLLKVDVMRHVPAQIQSFCREHGVDARRCAGAIREALDEVVNWQRFCKKPVADSSLPGFIVTKHVIREDAESTSTSWLENDPEDIATDFCGFAQAKTGEGSKKCVEALGKTLQLSFDWMLALPSCEQQTEGSDSISSSDSVTQSVADRLAAVEEMIAALQNTSTNDVELTVQEGLTEEAPSVVEEISETEAEENAGADTAPSDDLQEWEESTNSKTNDKLEDTPKQLTEIQEAGIATNVAEQDDLVDSKFPVADKSSFEGSIIPPLDQRSSRTGEEEAQKTSALTTQEEPMKEDADDLFCGSAVEEVSETKTEENIGVHKVDAARLDLKERPEDEESTIDVAEQDDHVESELTSADEEVSLTLPLDKRLSEISEEKEVQKSWKIGAALVLALSILYLVIDLMLHCVRYLASRIKAPKQLVSVLLHDILVLVGTGPRRTLKTKGERSDKLKKPSSRRPQAQDGEELLQSSTNAHDKLMQPQVTAPHPLTSFTCAAMLMAGRISIDTIPLTQDTQTTSSFVQDSNEALAIIQQKYNRELAAAQRIQSAWKAAQRKSSFKREWERVFNRICMVESSSVASPKKEAAQQPPALRRLVSNTLPPL